MYAMLLAYIGNFAIISHDGHVLISSDSSSFDNGLDCVKIWTDQCSRNYKNIEIVMSIVKREHATNIR